MLSSAFSAISLYFFRWKGGLYVSSFVMLTFDLTCELQTRVCEQMIIIIDLI
jgi:hypothetical protein